MKAPRRWPVVVGGTGGLAGWGSAWGPPPLRPPPGHCALPARRPQGLLLTPWGSPGELGSQSWELEAVLTGTRGIGAEGRPGGALLCLRTFLLLPVLAQLWRTHHGVPLPGSDACPSAHSADGTLRPGGRLSWAQLGSLLGSGSRPQAQGAPGGRPWPLTPGWGVRRPGLGSARGVSARSPQPGPAGSGRLLNKGAGGQWPLNWAGALAHGQAASCPR